MAHTITRRARSPHNRISMRRTKTRKLVKLLDIWLADETGYDERMWPRLKKSIEENRLSARKRFDD